jgi:glycosyltransferase 2 family protein
MRIVTGLRPPSIEWALVSVAATLAAVLAVSAFLIGFDALAANLRKLAPTAIGACVVLMFWQLGCRFARWLLYARRLGLRISVHEALIYYAAGLGMTLTPGRLGEVLRLWFLEKRFQVPYRRIAGLYVADRVSDAYAYLVLLGIGSIAYERTSSIAWGSLGLILILTLAIINPRPIIRLLTVFYAVMPRRRKIVLWLRRAVRNTSTLFQPRVFLPGVTIGTIGWCGPPGVMMVCLSQMGVDFSPLRAIAIYAAAALTGGSTMLPGGGGVTEAVLVSLLVASDVPFDAAISTMIVTRIAFLWLPAGLGILLLPVAMKIVRMGGMKADMITGVR